MTARREAGPLLLDTHVWIWLNEGVPRLSEALRRRIDHAAKRDGVWVSVISVWEVSLLISRRRLQVGRGCLDWVTRALAPPIALANLTTSIAVECNDLPGRLHSDQADRIIAATARVENLILVTRDRPLLDYARQGHLRALPC
jgi:PIN domain nuclease of toxin-antitoxin system